MRICVVGAGAVGGYLAAKLVGAGEDVSVIDVGSHLAAIAANGLVLIEDGHKTIARVKAVKQISDAGQQDLIVLAVKANQIVDVVRELPSIMSPETSVLTVQNGIPWWYFLKHGGQHEGRQIESIDPCGVIAAHVSIDRVVAGVVYPATEVVSPGVIRHIEGNRISLAEIDGSKTTRIVALSETFSRAGFKAPVISDVRAEIWTKLWGNASFNPISAMTHTTMEEICKFSLTRSLAADLMREIQIVAEELGIRFRISPEKRIAGAQAVGAHRTSMLQDIENGRATEADALVGSVLELGKIVKVEMPRLQTIYAIIKLLDESRAKRK